MDVRVEIDDGRGCMYVHTYHACRIVGRFSLEMDVLLLFYKSEKDLASLSITHVSRLSVSLFGQGARARMCVTRSPLLLFHIHDHICVKDGSDTSIYETCIYICVYVC